MIARTDTQTGLIFPTLDVGPNIALAMADRFYRPELRTRNDRASLLARELSSACKVLITGGQVHGREVAEITGEFLDSHLQTANVNTSKANGIKHLAIDGHDGFFTREKNIALAAYTADCVPVVIIDSSLPMVGVAHAGWRGTEARIAQHLAEKMIAAGASPGQMRAWIAPSISLESYEVNPELADEWREKFGETYGEFPLVRGRHINLSATNQLQLEQAGLSAANIECPTLCTLKDEPRFFSYRRDHQCGGHLITLVVIR